MQIFSSLRRSSSRFCRSSEVRGFTLIELLISAGIITVIAGMILARFNSFDSTVLLKSFAYEVATTLREAQIYSLSVVNTETGAAANFRYPYGLSFTPGATSYTFFRYNNPSSSVTPRYESSEVNVLRLIPASEAMEIYDVCVTNNGTDNCDISRLDISFRRPEFSAIFYSPTLGSPSTISAGKIYVRSVRNPSNAWVIEVKLLGQIVVYKL
jgi:prepilin-type N-terminal cleavage/methylation domain-containing protein